MSGGSDPELVCVSRKGEATIPNALRETIGIDTPGEVFIYEAGGRIVIEPVPSLEALHGIHAGEHEPGAVSARVQALDEQDREREEAATAESLDRHLDEEE